MSGREDRQTMSNPFQQADRGAIGPQRRARVFAKRQCRCGWVKAGKKGGCGRKLGPRDRWRIEHGDALENGGTDDDANLWISCEWCWPEKDADDHAEHAHDRRAYTKHFVPTEHTRSGQFRRRRG